MVPMCLELRRWLSCRNKEDMNKDSHSVVTVEGTPKIDIQESTSFLTTFSVEVSLKM